MGAQQMLSCISLNSCCRSSAVVIWQTRAPTASFSLFLCNLRFKIESSLRLKINSNCAAMHKQLTEVPSQGAEDDLVQRAAQDCTYLP